MKKNEYLVQIAVVEARDLAAKDASGSSDPFVRITVGNLPPQVSTAKMKATTAVFNQNFTFENLQMTITDFENFEAKIEVFDQNQFFQNELIGLHSIGLATLYRNPAHEIYNTWLRLTHPKEINKVQGFILVSAYIIGQNDAPPVHDANENNVEDEPDPFGGVPDDQLTGEQLQERRELQKKIAMVCRPMPYTKLAQLMVNIVKAEDLPILNNGTIDSFISVRANGVTQITSVLKNQQKPQYRVRMMFPITFPLQNDKIVIRVWDKRVCMADTFIGQIPEQPSEDDFFNITYLQSKGGVLPYRWFALYGIPANERPSTYEANVLGYKRNPKGTCYMGRVLLSLNLTPSEKPEKVVQPLGIYREPPIDRYMLRLDTYEVNQAKGVQESIIVRVRVGKEYFDSEEGLEKSPGQFIWKQKVILKTWEVEVAKNVNEQTDLFIELLNKEKKRVAFIRMPTSNQELTNDKPQWYEFKDLKLKGDSETVHSYILMNLLFGPMNIISQIPKIIVKKNMVLPYICKVYLYSGFDFCPDKVHEEIKLSYELRVADRVYKSETPQEGKNPIWNQCIEIAVRMEQNLEFMSGVSLQFFDGTNSLGQANITAMNCRVTDDEEDIKPLYQFYHILENGKSKGRILLGITLHRKKKNAQLDQKINIKEIISSFKTCTVQFPVYAIRQLPRKLKKTQLFARISNPNKESVARIESFLAGDEEETKYSPGYTDPNFLKLITLDIMLPENPLLMPQLSVEIYSKESLSQKYYIAIPLYNYYPGIDAKVLHQINAYYYATLSSSIQSVNIAPPDLTELPTEEPLQEEEAEPETIFSKKQSVKPSVKSKKSAKKSIEVLTKQIENSSDIIKAKMLHRGIENAYVQDQIVLTLEQEDVEEEHLIKKAKQARLTKLLKKLPQPLNTELNKQYLKKAILEQIFRVQDLEAFFTERMIEMSDDGIDYGRPIIKGSYDADIQKSLPFQRYRIFQLDRSASGFGVETNAILKADVKLLPQKQTIVSQKQSELQALKNQLLEKAEYVKRLRSTDYPFDFFDPVFHDYLKQQQFRCKVRVYIYRGLSLAAQSENIDAYHKMAGEQSRNSANPFLEIEVGEPGADPGEFVKKVSDPDKFISNTLNPTFLRSFELDAVLPQDCFLHVRVLNKGLMNSLIGAVKIDIEDRLMGEKKLKSRLSCEAYKEYFINDLEKLKYTENADDIKMTYQAEIANLTQKIESITTLEIPVEYQQLRHPEKLVSQGQLEMFVEVLPLEVSRLIPPALLVEKLPSEYEVRLIVWETFNIPLNPVKKAVDIFVRCVMDSSATGTGEEIAKETDTHMGSTDGNGEFNWRMKFQFKTPCQFPRMKISVHDFSVFGASPIIGEATISLKRVLSVMKTQSIYDMAPTHIKLFSAKEPDAEKGNVMMQMTILQKSMAEAKPVGEGQEEPNIDPFLKKPTEGRGLGAFFKGIGIPWGMICKQACMILLPMIISALVSFILFVKPGILMPKTA